jgi:hypothetical protein
MTYKCFQTVQHGVTQTVYQRIGDDGSLLTFFESSPDYQAYLAWLAEGNKPFSDSSRQSYSWEQAIAKRDNLLMTSDWTMTPGVTVNQHDWAVYRQILRDIPQTFKGLDPLQIIWPEKPSTAGPNTRAAEISAKLAEEAAAAVETSESLEEEEVAVKIDEEQTEV